MEKAVDALKQKQHVRALELFEQLADIDEQNPQAAYGLAVCYVELGRYTEAVELTKKMMEEGIGDYFDVLKLHITVLIQLRQYREVVALVRAVLEESDVPTDLRQHLMQLAAFAAAPAGSQPLVLDVREPWELQTASVRADGFELVAIPIGELPARLAELEPARQAQRPIACLCHHGARSLRVASFLQHHGFEHLANITGGIEAWSHESDPAVPRY